jgi:hypothetical protein
MAMGRVSSVVIATVRSGDGATVVATATFQTGSGAHPASCTVGTGGKAAEAWL